MLKLESNTKESLLIPGVERAALWDAYEIPVHNYNKMLTEMTQEIKYCRTRYPELHRQLWNARNKLVNDYDNNLDRIWNDQKSGTVFNKGERFEPHHVTKVGNLVMWEGLTAFTEIITGEIFTLFFWKAVGTGLTLPNFGNTTLEAEIDRTDMNINGGVNSDGIVLRDNALFAPGIDNFTASEFGAFDDDAGGRLEYRVVIERVEDRLAHIQNITEIQSSHTIVLQAVENKVV